MLRNIDAGAVDGAALAAAVAAAVDAQVSAAAAIAAAVGDDIPTVAQNQAGLATSAAVAALPDFSDIETIVAAAGPETLTRTYFEHLGADTEVEIIAPTLGTTILVWGYLVLSGSIASAVEWRLTTGAAPEDVGNIDVTPLGYLAAAGVHPVLPGARKIFDGAASQGLLSKKGGGIDLRGYVWTTSIPNP